jgi:hypothetical protein
LVSRKTIPTHWVSLSLNKQDAICWSRHLSAPTGDKQYSPVNRWE